MSGARMPDDDYPAGRLIFSEFVRGIANDLRSIIKQFGLGEDCDLEEVSKISANVLEQTTELLTKYPEGYDLDDYGELAEIATVLKSPDINISGNYNYIVRLILLCGPLLYQQKSSYPWYRRLGLKSKRGIWSLVIPGRWSFTIILAWLIALSGGLGTFFWNVNAEFKDIRNSHLKASEINDKAVNAVRQVFNSGGTNVPSAAENWVKHYIDKLFQNQNTIPDEALKWFKGFVQNQSQINNSKVISDIARTNNALEVLSRRLEALIQFESLRSNRNFSQIGHSIRIVTYPGLLGYRTDQLTATSAPHTIFLNFSTVQDDLKRKLLRAKLIGREVHLIRQDLPGHFWTLRVADISFVSTNSNLIGTVSLGCFEGIIGKKINPSNDKIGTVKSDLYMFCSEDIANAIGIK